MKKYVSIIVCALLIFVGCIITIDGEKVNAGKGSGRDTKIEAISQVGEVLSNLGASTEDYESATIEILTEAGINCEISQSSSERYNGNYDYSSSNSKSSATMIRKMTLYYTKDVVYYQVEARFRSSSEYSYSPRPSNSDDKDFEPTYMVADIKFEMYIDIEENKTLVRMNKYSATNNKSKAVQMNDTLNKWIDFTEVGSVLLGVNQINFEQLEIIGEYMQDKDKFKGSGDVKTLKTDFIHDFCNELFDTIGGTSVDEGDFKDAYFKMDLSNKVAPKGELYYALKFEDKDSTGNEYYTRSYNQSYSGMEKCIFTVKNINNTVVKFDDNIEIYDIDDFDEDGFLL